MPQWSLRTLLIATAVVPLAIFAIAKSTPFYVSAVMTFAAITWIVVAITAWTGTGPRQAWARGAILAASAYGLLVVWLGTELELRGSKLATSGALFYAHHAWAKPFDSEGRVPDGGTVLLGGIKRLNETPNEYALIDVDLDGVDLEEENLGLRVGPTSPSSSPPNGYTGTLVIAPYFFPGPVPSAPSFAKMGHIYWGVLFGIVGGWFAGLIQRHNTPVAQAERSVSHQA